MKMFFASLFVLAMPLLASAKPQSHYWVTVGDDTIESIKKSTKVGLSLHSSKNGVSLLNVKASEIADLSHLMHEEFHRCSGFMGHDSLEEAKAALELTAEKQAAIEGVFNNYQIDQQARVVPMLSQVQEIGIRKVIEGLSAFHNRYYKAKTGVDSQAWLKAYWSTLAQSRSDMRVDYFQHPNWPQPSVVLTVQGSKYPQEVVIIGGHADSINSSAWTGKESARAPGADDNASGIATITEIIRVMVLTNYQPERTVQFMGYAAEEVGLWGSQAIAASYKQNAVQVVGVVQFDMTNHKGTANKDIVMMSDYTNAAQNAFIGNLIDTYVKLPWGYSRCGYGCSDHASWTGKGYPASIPFESTMQDINNKIHTTEDTLAASGGHAQHAYKFALLGVAYMVELAK